MLRIPAEGPCRRAEDKDREACEDQQGHPDAGDTALRRNGSGHGIDQVVERSQFPQNDHPCRRMF